MDINTLNNIIKENVKAGNLDLSALLHSINNSPSEKDMIWARNKLQHIINTKVKL